MAREQFANDLGTGTSLSTALTDTTGTTVVVASVAGMPSSPQFRIRCESELMLVTALAGTTLTVVRGVEGTTAATHSSGSGVYHVLTAGGLTTTALQRAAFPATAGYVTPDPGVFSWVNQGSATAAANSLGTAVTITDPIAAGDHLRMLVINVPSPPYTLTAYFQLNVPLEATHWCGLCWYDGTKVVFGGLKINATSCYAAIYKYATTTSAPVAYQTDINIYNPDWWFRISRDGSNNQLFFISKDGLNWTQIHTVSYTDYLTTGATKVGVVWQAEGSSAHAFSASWISWLQG